ncbi:MAG TPA: hypothetical protein VEV40_10135 [Alloacidobacterium sp.]|nr:hypothetical protein [Alloacidobacterium sp.]HYK36310.1 hypothetical protein [Alloacidobacterium sp.]
MRIARKPRGKVSFLFERGIGKEGLLKKISIAEITLIAKGRAGKDSISFKFHAAENGLFCKRCVVKAGFFGKARHDEGDFVREVGAEKGVAFEDCAVKVCFGSKKATGKHCVFFEGRTWEVSALLEISAVEVGFFQKRALLEVAFCRELADGILCGRKDEFPEVSN